MRFPRATILAACLLASPALVGADSKSTSRPASIPERKPFGFDARFIDRSADPCVDFYQYACGGWMQANPLPAEYAIWGRFSELLARNQDELKKILETAAAPRKDRDPLSQQIGDYYASCMDEARAEKEGQAPLEPALASIAKVADPASVVLESLRLRRGGAAALFTFDSTLDARDSREVIAEADQGGLGLPDRDYYTKEDAKSVELREKYVAHVERMFQLAGRTPEEASAEAARVMKIETALAKGSMTRVERRDPEKVYNRMKLAELKVLAPSVPWTAYLAQSGIPNAEKVESINIASPPFFKALDELLRTASLDEWKSYLRWHAIRDEAPRLSAAFVDESFQFFGKTLTGAKELQPRWKRCVASTDVNLRDLLGKPYVDATFGADGKKRMQELVAALLSAMDRDLTRIAWMDEETRVRAKAKLSTFVTKIGYPEKWVDRSKIKIERGSWSENHRRARAFEFERDLAKIGKPFDRAEWRMTPPTVNASYNPQLNNITFPAGILQPPFFDKTKDDAVNFGAIGAVIGHEISHGFDDQGSQFDKDGNLKNWWTEKSAEEFKRRATCVEKQFSEYVAIDDLKVNGKLTLGENIGDLGGLRIAYAAYQETSKGKPSVAIDGLTPEQRFFLGWGQVWCQNVAPEEKRRRAQIDVHSPGQHRVNGPLSNMTEFRSAFKCPADAPMVRKVAEACEVW